MWIAGGKQVRQGETASAKVLGERCAWNSQGMTKRLMTAVDRVKGSIMMKFKRLWGQDHRGFVSYFKDSLYWRKKCHWSVLSKSMTWFDLHIKNPLLFSRLRIIPEECRVEVREQFEDQWKSSRRERWKWLDKDGSGDKWLCSRYIKKVEPVKVADGLHLGVRKKRR